MIVRSAISATTSEFQFCYRDALADETHFKIICTITNFSAKPEFCGVTDGISSEATLNSYNNTAIHRHYCTEEELLAIKRLWGSNGITFVEWFEEVLKLNDLSLHEKNRMKQAYAWTQS